MTTPIDDNYDDSWNDPDALYECAIVEDFDDEFADELGFDCGFIPGDGCLLAGTEDCDWECPYRRALEKHPNYPNCSIFGTDLIPNERSTVDLTQAEQP